MSANRATPSAGRPLSAGAIALMLMLCLSWGFNQIAVKLVLSDVPPMLQALIRSAGALPVLLIIGRLRGVKFFERDGTLWAGLFAGVIFGIEFVLIYRGLLLTSASRAVVFLYTAPFFVALGSYLFLGERLRAGQWGGLALSFAGVALAIGVPQANVNESVLFGDLLIVAGGALWAATSAVPAMHGYTNEQDGAAGRWEEPKSATKPAIPLCPGLTIVTAVASNGDYESIKTIESIDGGKVRLKYSSESSLPWWSTPHPELQKMTTHRTMLTADLQAAHKG